MKKLAIFCDGTWNDLRMPDRTNVSRLAKCVLADDGKVPQIVFYDEGVGVGAHVSQFADETVKLLGGAFGRGLDRKVEVAYRFLVTNYEPGDEIFLFGFSRGAFTARSLCGMVRKVGILKRECFDMTPKAFDLYHDKQLPTAPELVEFRAQYAHDVASGEEDYAKYLDASGLERLQEARRRFAQREAPATQAELFQYRDTPQMRGIDMRSEVGQTQASAAGDEPGPTAPEGPRHIQTYRMMYLGLWDTVGSMGVPERLGPISKLFNSKYAFHNTNVDSLISSVRHAVSIDEKRRVFSSTPISNIDALNRIWAERTGYDVDDESGGIEPESSQSACFVPYAHRPYQERWYPGDHGAVGGGNPQPGLSSHTLRWIAEGAERAGLAFEWRRGELYAAKTKINATADWPGMGKSDFLGEAGGSRPRVGPKNSVEVGNTAYHRAARVPGYRPDNLKVMAGQPFPRPVPKPPAGFPTAPERCWPV